MKKSILTAVSICLLSAFAYAGNAPGAVQKAFEQKFPNATGATWDKENTHNYEASFTWKGVKYSANFSDTGEWLETESPFSFNELPDKVQAAFNASQKGVTIKAVSKIETSKGVMKYEVEIKHGVKTVELFYTPDGTATRE